MRTLLSRPAARLIQFLLALTILTSFASCQTGTSGKKKPGRKVKQYIRDAEAVTKDTIKVKFRLYLDKTLEPKANWSVTPGLTVVSVKNVKRGTRRTATYLVKVSPPMEIKIVGSKSYRIKVGDLRDRSINTGTLSKKLEDDYFGKFKSEKPLGMTHVGNSLQFRVFVPRATNVHIVFFDKKDLEKPYKEIPMKADKDMVWEAKVPNKRAYYFKLYGYRIFATENAYEMFNHKVFVADPYSKATAQKNKYPMKNRTVILPPRYTTGYRWKTRKKWTGIKTRDAIIYEVHVRDMTMHPTSGVSKKLRGTYLGFIKKLPYLKKIGINTVELLPIHDIGNTEPPFLQKAKDPNGTAIMNTWNCFAYNHWGYMNSSYFAPESMYATGYTKDPDKWNGVDGRQLLEFKQLVDACHANGIAVVIDVVYNHVSQYDENPFKWIDYKYYFREKSKSGCGNDFKTERPMARRAILDSLKYYMTECRVDGFRFDLAGLIDHQTRIAIKKECSKINPNVMIIAEPWGGEYCPTRVSSIGWASWNDRIRNGIKGGDSNASGSGGSFIYGKASGDSIKKFVTGTLKKNGGLFYKTEHAINYLAAHDNHALGDHVRITTGRVGVKEKIKKSEIDTLAKLNAKEMKIHKLAALVLYTCQGGLMILEGQEWAQAKVTHPPEQTYPKYGDTHPWTLDHNSYEKDNETNWLNFKHMKLNIDLVNYYAGMAKLRTTYKAFRWADEADISWLSTSNGNALGWQIKKGGTFIVLANGNSSVAAGFTLPAGNWKVLVNDDKAGVKTLKTVSGTVSVPPTSGMVLKL